jgi:hypothetical protein
VTRIERENLIERYLRGEMSLEEEENFFIEVASNQELRYELKAYQVVERAIATDRTAGDRPYTALRARMQKQLTATPPAAAQAGTTGNTTSSSRKRWIVGLIGGTIMMVALIFFTRTPHQEAVVKNTPSQSAASLRDSTIIATPPVASEPTTTQQTAPRDIVTAPIPNAEAVPTAIPHNQSVQEQKRSAGSMASPIRQKSGASRRSTTPEGSTRATSNESRPAESVDTSTADDADSISIRFELMRPRSSQ